MGAMQPRQILENAGPVLLVVATACSHPSSTPPVATTAEADASPPTFVGSHACSGCHPSQFEAWRPSQHALALQEARPGTVLAPFAGETFTYHEVLSAFRRQGDRFVVRTDGPDGALADFEVKYTFGVAPLQQYLLALPGGRLQALGVAWDTRPKEAGGQRWFHLYPNEEIRAGDPLHWTGLQQNWNFMCADCHSTHVVKGYDAATRTYKTSWSEPSVGCEACHGPASKHLRWAALPDTARAASPARGFALLLDERKGIEWVVDDATAQPRRSRPRATEREIEVCARCHARRSQLTDAVTADDSFHDGFRAALLMPGLYFPDGQQREEVYDYGSFLQSKMYASGVTCSDCHDPHNQQLRLAGNATCSTCHHPQRYDTAKHHFHPPSTAGAQCASCHMPTRTYMVIDPRHDHSFRVPRPDLAAATGAPDACTACHTKRDAAWAAAEIARRRPNGSKGYQTFGDAFAALEQGRAGAAARVAAIAADARFPAIVRASAIRRLVATGLPVAADVLAAAASASHPLLRTAAAAAGASLDPSTLATLLADPRRVVRQEAAAILATVPPGTWPASLVGAGTRAMDEYLEAQRHDADRPEAQTNLGTALAARGSVKEADAAFATAIALDRTYVPAYVNLAEVYRVNGREVDAERVLREATLVCGASGAAHHALGLSLVRQKRYAEALVALAEACRREPDNVRFGYVYAVALHDTGKVAQAERFLNDLAERWPDHVHLRQTLDAWRR